VLARVREPGRAAGPWALDSGAFTELRRYGRWTVPARLYTDEVASWSRRVGRPDFAGTQDWPCGPATGLAVAEHQRRTVAGYLELRSLRPDLPWLPVLQGWDPRDYLDCVRLYEDAGVDLRAAGEPAGPAAPPAPESNAEGRATGPYRGYYGERSKRPRRP
jgi:hypothetical protein